MRSPRVRIGLIGAGRFAAAHLEAFRADRRAEVVALCRRDPAGLAAACERWRVPRGFLDYRELLALPPWRPAFTKATEPPTFRSPSGAGSICSDSGFGGLALYVAASGLYNSAMASYRFSLEMYISRIPRAPRARGSAIQGARRTAGA